MTITSLDYSDDNYVTLALELEPDSEGTYVATLHWPEGNLYTQNQIDLKSFLNWNYYKMVIGSWASTTHRLREDRYALRKEILGEKAETLSRVIFSGNLGDVLKDLEAIADGRTVLLTVFFRPGPLENIPWELLGAPTNSLNRKHRLSISVSRGVINRRRQVLIRGEKIRFAYVLSQPLPYPQFHSEFAALFDVLGETGKVDVFSSEPKITHIEFHKFAWKIKPNILHLALHGENGELLFSRGEDDQPIPYDVLVKEIRGIGSIGLAILNVCNSAKNEDDLNSIPGLARQLVEMGIPSALGMAAEITDRAVIEFSRKFYIALAESKSVRQAFDSAVEELRIYNQPDQLLWSVPMLYVNQDITPFIDFLEKIRPEPGKPDVDQIFIHEVLSASDEFIRAFEKIHPSPTWDAIDWKNRTRHLLLIFLRTRDLVNNLEYKLPPTNHLASRDLFDQILRIRRTLLKTMDEFDNTLPHWKSLDYSSTETAKTLRDFIGRTNLLVIDLRKLKELLFRI